MITTSPINSESGEAAGRSSLRYPVVAVATIMSAWAMSPAATSTPRVVPRPSESGTNTVLVNSTSYLGEIGSYTSMTRQKGDVLQALAEFQGALSDDAFTLEDLDRLRSEWE